MRCLDRLVAGVTGNERVPALIDPVRERLDGGSTSLDASRRSARRGGPDDLAEHEVRS